MILDLDETITIYESKAEHAYSMAAIHHTDEGVYLAEETKWRERAEVAEQLGNWLKELRDLREAMKK